MRQETALGRALREHIAGHPGCKGCHEYLSIAREHTKVRVIYEGPRTPYKRLSVQEAR